MKNVFWLSLRLLLYGHWHKAVHVKTQKVVAKTFAITWSSTVHEEGIRWRQKPQAPTPQTPKFLTAKW